MEIATGESPDSVRDNVLSCTVRDTVRDIGIVFVLDLSLTFGSVTMMTAVDFEARSQEVIVLPQLEVEVLPEARVGWGGRVTPFIITQSLYQRRDNEEKQELFSP
nr:hypothetical protein BaRGS_007325 [Batillaria attramentaria]